MPGKEIIAAHSGSLPVFVRFADLKLEDIDIRETYKHAAIISLPCAYQLGINHSPGLGRAHSKFPGIFKPFPLHLLLSK